MARNAVKVEDWQAAGDGYPVRGDDGVSYHQGN
jgi:hypothetical protein